MNVQHQLTELKQQLHSLSRMIEQLQENLSGSDEFVAQDLTSLLPRLDNKSLGLEMNVGGERLQHKDILFDETALLEGHPISEKAMTPDLQIKRLTAQLTVAYKRIAQLEEQLLSRQGQHTGNEYIYS